jgi:hypothetical protein
MKIAPLAEGDHSFSKGSHRFRLRQCGLDSVVFDKTAHLVRQQQIPMLGFAAQFYRLFCVAHKFLQRDQFSLIAPFTAHWRFNQSGFKLHSEAQTKLLQLFLDLVQRLLPEVAILQHLSLRLHR